MLALLAQEPMYGAQLRTEFESRTGGTWPLNVGQVYTTLARLERDGFVELDDVADGPARDDREGRIAYRLTDQGRAEVARWWAAPVDRGNTPRDELVIKLAWLLVLDNLICAAEAEIRWLDHVETRVARDAARAPEVRTRHTSSAYDDRSPKGVSR